MNQQRSLLVAVTAVTTILVFVNGMQEQNCTSAMSSQAMPVFTSVPAGTSAAPTGATLKLLSQVCMSRVAMRCFL